MPGTYDHLQLTTDAKNRALRTFVQGLGIDVAVGIAALILSGALDAISDTAGLITFGVAVAKTIATSAASYVMRRFMDRSSVPTPLPPLEQAAQSGSAI